MWRKKVVIIVGLLMLMIVPAVAVDITIDGNISDWGLSQLKTEDWSKASTWIPTKGGISFFVEDNQDPYNTGAINYNASYTGVHIYGNKSWQGIYREPLLANHWTEPYGGEKYDIEAMYVTDNSSYIFVLIVFSTGMLNDTTAFYLADLALNFTQGGGYGYEYGVNLWRFHNTNGDKFGIYYTPDNDDWTIPSTFTQNRPAEIKDFSHKVGTAIVKYNALNKYDHGRNNWIVEIAIPKNAVGNPDVPDNNPSKAIKMFWISEECGNDSGPNIPEFATILVPLAILLGSVYYFTRKR